jgi:hypothetical protein
MLVPPDLIMVSSEFRFLEDPRRCWSVKRFPTDWRPDDLLLLKIDPPFSGDIVGVEASIDSVIVATRHLGSTLFPVNESPVYVHVAISLVPQPESRERLAANETKVIAWAELYRSQDFRP